MARSLSAESARIEALLQILRQEQAALLAHEFERVSAFALAKNEHLAALGSLAEARGVNLRLKGLSSDLTGMNTLVAGTEVLRGPWQRLLRLAQEARQANLVNGRLINAQMHFTSGALSVLHQTSIRFATYGADGQKSAAPAHRALASA
ncbi:MAG: flagellar protein FlgN [Betaproteobacteria bacterium]|nr:flagellar protein FlgN [Betaproteobacteria bacterium]